MSEENDVLIDPEEELEQFKAVPVALSAEGEKRWLSLQESYRMADHAEWNRREQKKYEAHNAHIQKTNRFNLINSVVNFAALAAIVGILLRLV